MSESAKQAAESTAQLIVTNAEAMASTILSEANKKIQSDRATELSTARETARRIINDAEELAAIIIDSKTNNGPGTILSFLVLGLVLGIVFTLAFKSYTAKKIMYAFQRALRQL